MDIIARGNGSWAFRMGLDSILYHINKETGDLSLTLNNNAEYKQFMFTVETPRGVFLEVVRGKKIIEETGDGEWYSVDLDNMPTVLRYKKLPDPELSQEEMENLRHKVTRIVIDEHIDDMDMSDTLIGFVEWAETLVEQVPKEFRANAKCRFGTVREFDVSYVNVKVSYEAPETDEEVIERVKIERERRRLIDIRKRAKLKQLKVELGESY